MAFPPIIDPDEAARRLEMLFPRAAFDNVLNGRIAGSAVAAMVYMGAVIEDDVPVTRECRVVRPSSCLWMQDEVLTHTSESDRERWFRAATAGTLAKKKIAALAAEWGYTFAQWYADNSRETLRDEAFAALRGFGALRRRADLPTTSGSPRWVLSASFAALFDPALTDAELALAVETWRSTRMSPGDRLRIRTEQRRHKAEHGVEVTFPNGERRLLETGDASLILQGIVEQWARARLIDPVVLTISEPGAKVYVTDAAEIAALGITINVSDVLPDALIVDIGTIPPTFWVIEAVASDGPVTEDRKADLIRWATDQHIPAEDVRFVSAFISRGHTTARKRLRDLAVGTLAWYLDEPTRELSWREIPR